MQYDFFMIVGMEESQAITIKMRKRGIKCFSCDLQPCSGGHPEWHFIGDIFEILKGGMLVTQSGDIVEIKRWAFGIFHPPCTYLTVSANRWLKNQPKRKSGALVGKERRAAVEKAVTLFMALVNCNIDQWCIENPIGIMSTRYRKPNQTIQPYNYGHGETKATCLWLKGIPRLNGFDTVEGREQKIFKMSNTPDRAKLRSKTYNGIAKAMATQWPIYIKS